MKSAMLMNLLLVTVSVIVGVLVVEAFLRFDDASEFDDVYSELEMNNRHYNIVDLPDRLGRIKRGVVVVGDSFVVGEKCGRTNNVTGQLSRILEREDIVNLGQSGTGLFSYAQRLEDYTAEFGAPGLIVVLMYSNDISMEPMMCRSLESLEAGLALNEADLGQLNEFCAPYEGADVDSLVTAQAQATGGGIDAALKKSYVYRLVREVVAQLVLRIGLIDSLGRAAYPVRWSDTDSLHFRIAKHGLGKIIAQARLADAPVIVAFYPNVEDLADDSPVRQAYQTAIPVLSEALAVPIYSGYEAYLGNPRARESMVWSLTDAHPSCEAHEIMASWLADHILDLQPD